MGTGRYTLVIPTYNRPVDLGRQLRFLAYQKADFPVLLLDSSSEENHARNRQSAQGLAIVLELVSAYGGDISLAKSELGGACVRLEIAPS